MIALTLLAMLGVQVSPDASGDQWQLVGEVGGVVVEIDRSTIVRDGDQARAIFRARGIDQNDNAMRIVATRARFDCARGLIGLEGGQVYDGGGTLIRTVEVPAGQVRFESLGDDNTERALFSAACGAS